ncbi:MAG: twin-arginine translocase subunit TatC [Candidatus Omnitrophica bacterium]|nr:twin-arginine translocase subunit TatC [Candidatus Omnitrophota bacterium]
MKTTDKEMTFLEHMEELRYRIIICLIAIAIGVIIGFPFSRYALRILKLPGYPVINKLVFFSPQEGFLIYLRISFFIGLIFSLPVIIYQLFAFIEPALEERTKKYVLSFIFLGTISFLSGVVFVYFILLPTALKFLLSFGSSELEPVISANKYISFVIMLLIAGGIVFQMPVLSFLLTKLGLINWKFLKEKSNYAVVIIFVVAALITPTVDIFNLLILALPMIFLYGISILVSFIAHPKVEVFYYEQNKTLQNI